MPGLVREVLEEKGADVFTITPDATVARASVLMKEHRCGGLLAVADGDEPCGIITERDVMTRVVAEGRDPEATTVADVMTRELAVVKPTISVEDAMAVVTDRRLRHLPVVEEGKVVGLITSGDLTRWIIRDREFHIQQLVEYIVGRYPG